MKSNNNILEEDGIEDLHFYFVSFANHRQKVLSNHESKLTKKTKSDRHTKAKSAKAAFNETNESKTHCKTIESMSDCELY